MQKITEEVNEFLKGKDCYDKVKIQIIFRNGGDYGRHTTIAGNGSRRLTINVMPDNVSCISTVPDGSKNSVKDYGGSTIGNEFDAIELVLEDWLFKNHM